MKAGLIGGRLSHSLSPRIHSAFFRLTGISGSYSLFETGKDSLGPFLSRLAAEGFTGVNVTIPYKTEVIQHLDGLSNEAEAIGAVNTILLKYGQKFGYNTDYYGLKALLKTEGITVRGASVVILGTGGAARCAAKLARDMGAADVTAVSRSPESADSLFTAISYEELRSLSSIDVLINTTPVGMSPDTEGCPVPGEVIEACGAVVDLVYNPPQTQLIRLARERGIKAANGLLMLCAQAVRAQEVWTGMEFGRDIYDGVYEYMKSKAYKTNIVLTGMPGSGKTTIAALLAKRRGMELIDTDAMVESAHGPIPQVFSSEGEAAFREYERAAVKSAAAASRSVISTGGGVILDERNMSALSETGTVVFLDRPLDALLHDTDTSGRPLLAGGKSDIKKLYDERHDLYVKYADIVSDNSADAESCAEDIILKLEELL